MCQLSTTQPATWRSFVRVLGTTKETGMVTEFSLGIREVITGDIMIGVMTSGVSMAGTMIRGAPILEVRIRGRLVGVGMIGRETVVVTTGSGRISLPRAFSRTVHLDQLLSRGLLRSCLHLLYALLVVNLIRDRVASSLVNVTVVAPTTIG